MKKTLVMQPASTTSHSKSATSLPSSSENTGQAPIVPGQLKKTGTALGDAGLSKKDRSLLSVEMQGASPRETDKALQASLGPWLRPLLDTKPKQVFEGTAVVEWRIPPPQKYKNHIQELLRALNLVMQPANPNEVFSLLGRLKMMTASRKHEELEMEAIVTVYAESCLEYPGDVVRHVLKTQPNHSKWWPTWAELGARLDLHSSYRVKLRDALANPPEPEPEAKPRITEEQLDALMEKFRNRS